MGDKDEGVESEKSSLAEEDVGGLLTQTYSTNDSNSGLSTEDIEKQLVEDFKSFLNVDISAKTSDIDTIISGLLNKLEELCSFMELIRTESKDVFYTIAPVLHERCEEMKPLFQKIDQLEKFIGVVRECVDDAEEKVRIAEKEVGSKNIKKILHNVPVPKFLLRKKEIQSYMKKDVTSHDYKELKRFRTKDYFQPFEHSDDNPQSNVEE